MENMDISLPPGFSLITKDDSDILSEAVTSGCFVCGKEHETEKCSIFEHLVHIKDKEVPPRAVLTLPLHLRVETLADGTKTIITEKVFAKGTQFGPYEAKRLYAVNPFDIFPLKIFGESENILPLPDCYLDTKNEEHCNWMCYIAPASNLEEQNLICYQLKNDIYYSAIRDIERGEQLKVWYSSYYASKIGVKIHSPKKDRTNDFVDDVQKIQEIAEKLPPNKLGASDDKHSWCCKFCSQIESNVVKFAKHLQKHYKKMIENYFNCDICSAGFSTKNLLMKHLRTVHIVITGVDINTSELPPEPFTTFKPDSTQKIDLIDPLPIDNLINETLADSDPNLLMLDQLNNGLYSDLSDVDTFRAIFCDDNTKASKIAQEKSIADFSLELVESDDVPKMQQLQPPFICDICSKSFKSLDCLHRHLSKHTGEFTCVHCLEVFTRKENYIRHPCLISNSSSKKFNCPFCQKIFLQQKYLRRHMRMHIDKYTCTDCGKDYKSLVERNAHNCASIPEEDKDIFTCSLCGKKFSRKAYLQKHIRRFHHKSHKEEGKEIICEICAETFKSVKVLKSHILSHADPKYECNICYKKFHKPYVYQNHLQSHGAPNFACEYCYKKFKTKKGQITHMKLHENNKTFTCSECGQHFKQRISLENHQTKEHNKETQTCPECNQSFNNKYSFTNHLKYVHNKNQGNHKCNECGLRFSKQYLLKRHVSFKHSNKIYVCQYCNHSFKQRSSMRRHLNKMHLEKKDEWNDPAVITSFLTDANRIFEPKPLALELDNNNEITSTNPDENHFMNFTEIVNNTTNSEADADEPIENATSENEVLLSLPETEYTEISDQQITLGKNAFILEDGTIVQPQPGGNLMFYVINQ